jgi:Lrp/AsnC family transcriptional regulator, regulator for asnA, asnC and gidA
MDEPGPDKGPLAVPALPGPPVQLDGVDRLIVAELQHNGRITTQALAAVAGVSEVTARRRLRRLQADGVVQVAAGVDPFQVGMHSPALVGIRVERARLHEVARELSEHPNVSYVAASTGTFHLYAEVMASSNDELGRLLLDDIGMIDGVIDTETALILRIYKQPWNWTIAGSAQAVDS